MINIPKKITMRLDLLCFNDVKFNCLVDQISNGIYYTKIYDPKDNLTNIFSDFKYMVNHMNHLDFYVPLHLKENVIKIDYRINYVI